MIDNKDGPKLGEECDEAKSKCSQRTSGAVCEEKKCACDKNSKLMAEKYGIAQKCVPDGLSFHLLIQR